MIILIDKYVPFIQGVLEPYAEVSYLEPEEFTPARVHDADALIIRTRTRCNAALLDGSRVRFIATATIGYDHIDRDYCAAHGIYWTNSPGCNAQAVCDYVEEAINYLSAATSAAPSTIGIVGVGHVGSLVAKMAERKGLCVLLNDPPKGIGVSLDEIARKCDIITFHTPLVKGDAPYPTYHLCNAAFLAQCKPGAVIINAARGGIVDEAALVASGHPCIIDTWEGEPNLNPVLLGYAQLATYHIAGYSLQGKINATNNCLSALSRELALPLLKAVAPIEQGEGTPLSHTSGPGDSAPGWLCRISEQLKSRPADFETLRETYPLR